jgi:hypothetical protein
MVCIIKEQCCRYGLENSWFSTTYDSRVTILQRKKLSFGQVDAPDPKHQKLHVQSSLKSHSKKIVNIYGSPYRLVDAKIPAPLISMCGQAEIFIIKSGPEIS